MRNLKSGPGAKTVALCAALLVLGGPAAATTDLSYTYDELGRLETVTYPDGTVVSYVYDPAGNRTQKGSSGFTSTIQITGSSPVNLRSLANTAGYNGVQNATIVFEVGNGVTIMGDPDGGIGVDTGTWPSGPIISLSLVVKSGGAIYGGGGNGGAGGGTAYEYGFAGTPGGDAVYVRKPISVTVQSGGAIMGGGDGGQGGYGYDSWNPSTFEDTYFGGGGGGGGFPNGLGGAGGTSPGYPCVTGIDGNPGSNGTTSGGGAAGAGIYDPGWGVTTGDGVAGEAAGNSGYAIRKNGHTVSVSNSGTIAGAAS
jgi:YD repeat-containing protein